MIDSIVASLKSASIEIAPVVVGIGRIGQEDVSIIARWSRCRHCINNIVLKKVYRMSYLYLECNELQLDRVHSDNLLKLH